MKFVADENFPYDSYLYLKSKGFDITHIAVNSKSISDSLIIQMAIDEQRIIITFDKDFGELIFKYNLKPIFGVIYLRLESYSPDEPGKIIENLLNMENLNINNTILVLDENGIRQRKF